MPIPPNYHSSPYFKAENAAVQSLLRPPPAGEKRSRFKTGGLLKMFKLFPMLTSGCKMVALLGKQRNRPLLKDNATTVTLFGYRKGRVGLAIQEDPHCLPGFVIELPIHTALFHKEMTSDVVRIALESETKTHKKKLLEEFVWAVYCNGRKIGYSIRRKQMSDDELHVMQLLRGVSMGAGVLPPPPGPNSNNSNNNNGNSNINGGNYSNNEKEITADGELTYIRARFERVGGSKDSESYYMINPDGAAGPELSIFFLRAH